MMTPLFAPAAVACLVDGRTPRPEEIEEVARKIWQDVYARTMRIAWEEVDRRSGLYLSIQAAALAALGAFVSIGGAGVGSVA